MSDIQSKITAIIAEKLSVDAATIQPTSSFETDLGADSLDRVELIMELEKEFGMDIPDEEAEQIKTVGEVMAYVEKHKS